MDACRNAGGSDYPCEELVTPEVVQDQLAANASYSWDDLESLTQGNPIDKGMFIVATLGSGGKSAVRVVFCHGARHLAGTGLSQAGVEAVIAENIQQLAREGELGTEWWGHVAVNGQVIQYRAYEIAQGVVNVGTYVIPVPGKYIKP